MSNIAATYIGIIVGFVLGGLISWWIYNRQEKAAVKQQEILDHIGNLRKAWTYFRKDTNSWAKHDEMLNNILILDTKINSLLEKK